eukprot:4672999-Amphidinium_carterae.1
MTDDTKLENKGPSRWDGSEETWQEWRFEFVNWSRRHELRLPEMLKQSTVELYLLSDMDVEARVLAGKVMTDLALKTTGAAKRLIMSIEEPDNGFLAFRELSRRAEAGTGLRETTLLTSILKFDFNGKDLRDRIVQFDQLVQRYESQLGPSQQGLSDPVRISVVTSGVTGDLRKQLLARSTSFTSYEHMRQFIMDYLDAQRVYAGPNSQSKKKNTDGDPMEIDALQWPWKGSKGKGDKGSKGKSKGDKGSKGKSKSGKQGKGKNKDKEQTKSFEGYCGCCGRWGHRQRDCWYNAGNGKSGKPGGGTSSGSAGANNAAASSEERTVAGIEREDGAWVFALSTAPERLSANADSVDRERNDHMIVDSGSAVTAVAWDFGSRFDTVTSRQPRLKAVGGHRIDTHGARCLHATATDVEENDIKLKMEATVAEVSSNVLSVSALNAKGISVLFPAEDSELWCKSGNTDVL